MKEYQAIMFDLDGTLVPMDMQVFMKGYFSHICQKLTPLGLEPKAVVDAIWYGTGKMVKNAGTLTNKEAFWLGFEEATGIPANTAEECTGDFYVNEFSAVKAYTMENPLATRAVKLAHEKGDYVILATNPFFPMDGQISRMGWVGLKEHDFDHITSYEYSHFCKPNPKYYEEICEKFQLDPQHCLMVGNDEEEDAYAASLVGMDGYLITDTMIERPEHKWTGKRGTFKEFIAFLESL